MTMKQTAFRSLAAMAVATLVACAGDGAPDPNDDGFGDNTGGNTGGNTNTGIKGGNTSSPTGGGSTGTTGGGSTGTTGGGSTGTTGGATGTTPSAGMGIVTTGGFHTTSDLGGYFWTAADSAGSMINPVDFATNGMICAKGTAAKVEGEDYSNTWGAMLGFNLKQAMMPPNDPESVMLSAAGSFTIGLSGTVPDGVRFKLAVGGVDYCVGVTTGTNTVKLNSLTKECWTAGGAAYAGEAVKDVAVQVTTNANAAVPFDFCITEFKYTP